MVKQAVRIRGALGGNTKIVVIGDQNPKVGDIHHRTSLPTIGQRMNEDYYSQRLHSTTPLPQPTVANIEFASGDVLTTTPAAILKTSKGWVSVKHLQVGDRVLSGTVVNNVFVSPEGRLLRAAPASSGVFPWFHGEDPRGKPAMLASKIVNHAIDNYGELSEHTYSQSRTRNMMVDQTTWGFPTWGAFRGGLFTSVVGPLSNWVTGVNFANNPGLAQPFYVFSLTGSANLLVDVGRGETPHVMLVKI